MLSSLNASRESLKARISVGQTKVKSLRDASDWRRHVDTETTHMG